MCRYVCICLCVEIFLFVYTVIYVYVYIYISVFLCKSIHLFTCLSADASSHYRSPHPIFNRRLTGEFRGTDSTYQPPYTYVPLNQGHVLGPPLGVPNSEVDLYLHRFLWLGLQTVPSLERCPLFRVSFVERFHCTAVFSHSSALIGFSLVGVYSSLDQSFSSLCHFVDW